MFLSDFTKFLKTFGILALAIGIVIGSASSTLVQAVVTDIISPLVGLFLPSGSLQTMNVNMTSISGKPSEFKYGDVISQMITFLIIAFLVFLAYKFLSRLKVVEDKTLTGDNKK